MKTEGNQVFCGQVFLEVDCLRGLSAIHICICIHIHICIVILICICIVFDIYEGGLFERFVGY